MIAFGRIETSSGLDLGDDRRIEHARLSELIDIGLGDGRLHRIRREYC
jgi:hypothetical protein